MAVDGNRVSFYKFMVISFRVMPDKLHQSVIWIGKLYVPFVNKIVFKQSAQNKLQQQKTEQIVNLNYIDFLVFFQLTLFPIFN